MADNYIERRMEELRSGRLAVRNRRPGIKPNSRRILIAGGSQGEALKKVLEYRRAFCRVAVFDEDEAAGKRLAHDHGIRFHHVSLADKTALKREIHSLLSVWRGIDVIAGAEDVTAFIDALLREWKDLLPIPDKTIPEIVIIDRKNPDDKA